jgi:hypothetical protein
MRVVSSGWPVNDGKASAPPYFLSLGIVKEDAECMAVATVQLTNTVAHVRSVEAANSPYRPVPSSNYDGLTLLRHDHVWCALRSGALLNEHELAAIVVFTLLTERENHLEWEEEFPVQILM